VNNNLGKFYHMLADTKPTIDSKTTQLLLAKSNYEQALGVYLKICGPEHSYTQLGASRLVTVSRELGIEYCEQHVKDIKFLEAIFQN
jgi:hypothetical protein